MMGCCPAATKGRQRAQRLANEPQTSEMREAALPAIYHKVFRDGDRGKAAAPPAVHAYMYVTLVRLELRTSDAPSLK